MQVLPTMGDQSFIIDKGGAINKVSQTQRFGLADATNRVNQDFSSAS